MSFGSRLAAASTDKRHNHPRAVAAKAEIRANVLAAMDGNARVFHAFAGDGEMWRRVWRAAADYCGCDLRWYDDARLAFAADNRRVLRAIDLAPFNVFDLDAFGSPWEQVLIVAERRPMAPGERLAFVITEGSALKIKFGSFPFALCQIADVRPTAAGGASSQDEVIGRAIEGLMKRIGADRVVGRWEACRRSGSAMRYIGIVFERTGSPP